MVGPTVMKSFQYSVLYSGGKGMSDTFRKIVIFSMVQDRLSALAMLSVKRNFIIQIPDFNQRVIDRFAAGKDRRMDFLFK